MIFKLYERITDSLIKCNAMEEEDRELVEYGLDQGVIIILNIITTIILGVIFGMVWQSILYFISYSLLRSYVGGYHARTRLKCYLWSLTIIVAMLACMKYITWNTSACIILAFICGIIIFVCAPRADENKPFDEVEEVVFKKRARVICIVEIIIILLCYILDFKAAGLCVLMSLVTCVFTLYMDILKHLLINKSEEVGMY